MHHCTIFIKISLTVVEILRLMVFQNGGHLPSRISKNFNSWVAIKVRWANLHHDAKFYKKNLPNGLGDSEIFPFSTWRPSVILVAYQVGGSVCIKISQMVAEISHLTIFQNGDSPPSWIFKFLNISLAHMDQSASMSVCPSLGQLLWMLECGLILLM